MSSTFYIDTNRQNSSVKSSNTNAEWEYKLSNTLQIPAGSEIAIQDIFIHKQGISGATIAIDEDIDETIWFSVYLSDNPHFVPKATFSEDKRDNNIITGMKAYEPTFAPFGQINPNVMHNPYFKKTGSHHTTTTGSEFSTMDIEISNGIVSNAGLYAGEPAMGQRIGLFCDDGRGNPRLKGGEWQNLNDPYITGYSECPMMAIFVDENSKYTTLPTDTSFDAELARGAEADIQDNELNDPRFKPYVKSINIHIPKGVYSIGEIADLIDGQINGKYVGVKQNDDYYTDTYVNKQNEGLFTGTLETDGIYSKVESFDRYGHNVGLLPDENNGDAMHPGPSNAVELVYGQTAYRVAGPGVDGPINDTDFPNFNPSGQPKFGHYMFNDPYGLPFYPDASITSQIQVHNNSGGLDTETVPRRVLAYNRQPATGLGDANNKFTLKKNPFMKGRNPVQPTEKQLFYIPVHYYNLLIKLWKYNDIDEGTTTPAHINSFLEETGNWTNNFRNQMRYGFQTRVNAYANSVSPVSGLDCGRNHMQIGLHTKNNKNKKSDYIASDSSAPQDEEKAHIGLNAVNLNYDVNNTGYYVGTPDFSFSYDTDKSAFSISGLCQMPRVPSADINGNPMNSEGQTALYMRRAPKIHEEIFTSPQRTLGTFANFPAPDGQVPTKTNQAEMERRYNIEGGTNKYIERIINTLNSNEDRLGGIAVYNWAYQTALKFGDIDPKTHVNQKGRLNANNTPYKVYDAKYQYLWKYEDYFSSKKLAKDTWEKTLWFKLGFTYENLQDSESWESINYYDLPVGQYTNEPDDAVLNNPHATYAQLRASKLANTYYQWRDNNYFQNEDFKLYGKTTKAEITVDTATSVSTTFNNMLYTFEERQQSGKAPPSKANIHQILRTYDNNDINKPFFGSSPQIITTGHAIGNYPSESTDYNYNLPLVSALIENAQGSNDDAYNTVYSYDNSMYDGKTRVPILTDSKTILSSKLPRLSEQGYFIITSDLVDFYQDDIKQGQPLPIIGILPISNLSNQDFISGQTDIVHTTQQVKNINSIKIKVLNPDLTIPILEPNSSVILKITVPLPKQTPLLKNSENKTDDEAENKKKRPQPNPHSKETKSGN